MYGPTTTTLSNTSSLVAAARGANTTTTTINEDEILNLMIDQIDDTYEADFEQLRFQHQHYASPTPIKVGVVKTKMMHQDCTPSNKNMDMPILPSSVLTPLSQGNYHSNKNNSGNMWHTNFEHVDEMLDEILEIAETDVLVDDIQLATAVSPTTNTYPKTLKLQAQPPSLTDLFGMSNNKRSITPELESAKSPARSAKRARVSNTSEDKIPFHISSSTIGGFPMPKITVTPDKAVSSVLPQTTKVTSPATTAMTTPTATSAVVLADVPDEHRFRSYQNDMWYERLKDLVEYKKTYGHCLVPHNWAGNVPLAQWVKRQRYQYKLLMNQTSSNSGKNKKKEASTMSEERLHLLESMGFVWDSHKAAWEEKYSLLVEYQKQYGHCNVSGKYEQHRPLCIWLKCQRRQRKFMEKNEKSTMTLERIERLDKLGFDWNPRNL